MILHSRQGFRGTVWDLDTGRRVRKVIWLDTDRGELEAYQVGPDGEVRADLNGDALTYRARGRFRFEPAPARDVAREPRIVMGAPECARCRNTVTLPGDDLCVFCRAADRGNGPAFAPERLGPGDALGQGCQAKGCGRPAVWGVSDEVDGTPQEARTVGGRVRSSAGPGTAVRAGRWLWDRAVTVGRRFYCDRHYRPPRLLDARGETVAEVDVAGRPG